MAIEVLLVQVLVLVFTAALWWIARRDLASRVPPPAPSLQADTAELEQLCATLETLVTSLARRLDAVERAAALRPLTPGPLTPGPVTPGPVTPGPVTPGLLVPPPVLQPAPDLPPVPADPLPDPRYEPVYALLASGVADPVEIARRTGLGRGEVDLILSLRGRRAL